MREKWIDLFFKAVYDSYLRFVYLCREQFVKHVYKRVFQQIIECSDVGIDPEEEKEMEELKAYGLQTGEEENIEEHSIKFNYDLIADNLFKMANKPFCVERNKKHIYDLVKK